MQECKSEIPKKGSPCEGSPSVGCFARLARANFSTSDPHLVNLHE